MTTQPKDQELQLLRRRVAGLESTLERMEQTLAAVAEGMELLLQYRDQAGRPVDVDEVSAIGIWGVRQLGWQSIRDQMQDSGFLPSEELEPLETNPDGRAQVVGRWLLAHKDIDAIRARMNQGSSG